MAGYKKEFELRSQHSAPYEAAEDLADNLDGDWEVLEVRGSGRFELVTEEE